MDEVREEIAKMKKDYREARQEIVDGIDENAPAKVLAEIHKRLEDMDVDMDQRMQKIDAMFAGINKTTCK